MSGSTEGDPKSQLCVMAPNQNCRKSLEKESKLQLLLTVLPILSATLYLIGTLYHASYLGAFGVNDAMFPLPLDQVWLYGFTSLLSFGLKPMLTGISIALLVICSAGLAALLSSFPKVQHFQAACLQRLRSWLVSPQNQPPPAFIELVNRSRVPYFYMAGVFFLVVAIVFAVRLSSNAGEQAAEHHKVGWAEGTQRTAVVEVSGEQPFRAFQITCGAMHCAFWTGKETRLIRHEAAKFSVYPASKPTKHE